ncbi:MULTISPECIES: murein biosynthesis integral membrane protein MurJ [unclassified Coleofasciculus]|uniref:murein biosynthesis integral membrane protein MurJ n=1 Tax=unclassified Coleofasciculus TaxID=2692782 RepID=UPI00188282A5|nr:MULTISPECIES: murein biosynthesis integral membrane protein MurJ [unclassified Coleofasciculus]MBE9125574.1 murein biosynthesis integral membrane protein MurJ [Coleofasciculus sp. LEGE 07081]MBE9147791.1 murein biosynthesis integral membrane protein MurJ [Coleofasciculus sp. LEGE 07092]
MSEPSKPSRSLAGIAGIVAVATLISKIFGLVREQAIAAAFGVGAVVNAYAYAYVIPGFLLILLGGINGPFHSALVSVLAKRDKSDAAPLVETVTTLVSGILLLVTLVLILFAGTFIDILAPGLDETTRAIAIQQLQIMAPLAVLAGLIGIGFGTLNASDHYWLPSVSPLFSSLAVVLGVGWLAFSLGGQIDNPQYLQLGGMVLAGGTLAGAIWQWLMQLIAQWRSGMGKLRLRFNWRIPGVMDVMRVMAPATLSSGMLHINVYTDLFFASFIPNAAAAMRYANFIVLTPVGIISNMILVPMLPVFSRLAAPENWSDLKLRIRQGLLLTALTMLPLTAIFLSLSVPIVRVIYERYAFEKEASLVVAPVLMAYGLGMFFYLGRDVLVRVFYALGDGETPFRISMANIFLNALLDYLLVNAFATPGLVLATIGVNITSMGWLLWILNRRLNGLPLAEWGLALLALTGSSLVAGLGSWGVSWGWQQWFGSGNLLLQLLQISLSMLVAFAIFAVFVVQLKLPEVDILVSRLRQKFGKRTSR